MSRTELRAKLLAMTEGARMAENIHVCPRCGGSGHYSYNPIDKTRCYGCNGIGFVRITGKKETK